MNYFDVKIVCKSISRKSKAEANSYICLDIKKRIKGGYGDPPLLYGAVAQFDLLDII